MEASAWMVANDISALPAGTIPLSPEQLDRMPDELQAELAGRGALYPIRVTWGRKLTA